MESYICPLCKQEVSKSIFEKITGIWDEKEKRLLAIKNREKDLKKREQSLIKKFEEDKKKLTASMDAKFNTSLDLKIKAVQKSAQKEQEKLKKEKSALEKTFKNRLAAETNRLLNLEKVKQKHLMNDLQRKFEKQATRKIEKSTKPSRKTKTDLNGRKEFKPISTISLTGSLAPYRIRTWKKSESERRKFSNFRNNSERTKLRLNSALRMKRKCSWLYKKNSH